MKNWFRNPEYRTQMTNGVAIRIPRGLLPKKIEKELKRQIKKSQKRVKGFRAGFTKESVMKIELDFGE